MCFLLAIPAVIFQDSAGKSPFVGGVWLHVGGWKENHLRKRVTFELGFEGCSFPYQVTYPSLHRVQFCPTVSGIYFFSDSGKA